MFIPRIRTAVLTIAAGLSLGACSYGGGFGYSGLSVGISSGGYYDDYYDPYYGGGYYGGGRYSRGGYGYSPYYGWNNGFYYPGTGYYVYDQYRRPYRWNDHQRVYWEGRRQGYRGQHRDNWGQFRNYRGQNGQHFREEDRAFRQHYRDERRALRRGEVSRDQFREHRREENRNFREHRRSHRRGGN